MEKSVGRLIGHIISLIIKNEIDEAIEQIRKEGFQCHAREIKFITGTDLLIDGGVIAAIRTGEYQLG